MATAKKTTDAAEEAGAEAAEANPSSASQAEAQSQPDEVEPAGPLVEGGPAPVATAGSDALVVKPSDKIEGVFADAEQAPYVTLTRDVVEEFYFPGTIRPAHRILFTKGQTVARAVIDRLNSGVAAQSAGVGTDSVTPS